MVWQIAFATTSCLPSSPMSEFPPFKIRRRDASSWNALVASCLRPSVLTVSNHRMIFTYDDDTSLKLHCLQSQTKDLDWVRMQIEEQQLVTGDETKNSNTHTHTMPGYQKRMHDGFMHQKQPNILQSTTKVCALVWPTACPIGVLTLYT